MIANPQASVGYASRVFMVGMPSSTQYCVAAHPTSHVLRQPASHVFRQHVVSAGMSEWR
jgi:hypothetical protein